MVLAAISGFEKTVCMSSSRIIMSGGWETGDHVEGPPDVRRQRRRDQQASPLAMGSAPEAEVEALFPWNHRAVDPVGSDLKWLNGS